MYACMMCMELLAESLDSLLLRHTGLAGDPTSLEETVESDSERGE